MGESVLFRVDAGRHIGLGHLHRCLALAGAFQQRGVRTVILVAGGEAGNWPGGMGKLALEEADPGSPKDLHAVVDAARREGCSIVVVDSYRIGASYLTGLREAGLFVTAVDDFAAFAFPCQAVLNDAAGADTLPYQSSSGDTSFLLGPQYALLPVEFWDEPERDPRDGVQEVLVTVGGTDSQNVLPSLLRALDALPGAFLMTAVLGPFFEQREAVVAAARACRHAVKLVDAPDSLYPLMMRADLAISAAGHTLYELAAAGVPTVALLTAPNQEHSLRALSARGAVVPVALTPGVAEDSYEVITLRESLAEVLDDAILRRRLSEAVRRLVNRRGAWYAADALLDLWRRGPSAANVGEMAKSRLTG